MPKNMMISKLDEDTTAITFVKADGRIYDTVVSLDRLKTWISGSGNLFRVVDFRGW